MIKAKTNLTAASVSVARCHVSGPRANRYVLREQSFQLLVGNPPIGSPQVAHPRKAEQLKRIVCGDHEVSSRCVPSFPEFRIRSSNGKAFRA
jgi:hypothetical protein